jgi:hypothetical protein
MPDYVHSTTREVVSLPYPAPPGEVQRLLAAGYSPREVTIDVAPGGRLRQRTADPTDTEYDPQRRVATEEQSAALRETAYDEGISRDAQSFGNQVRFGVSTLASDLTLGATTALGLDIRARLPDRERALAREQTQGVEAFSHLLGAVSPVGAEALITRGASWMGSTVARLGAEGAAGGTFNALQEAMIARDPDVFAERFMSDMGMGALLGVGLGIPLSGVSRLSRMAQGTSAARANRQMADAAMDVPDGPIAIQEMAELFDEALNPSSPWGRIERAVGGAAAPRGRAAQFRQMERLLERHQAIDPAEVNLIGDGIANQAAELRRGRGLLGQVDPNQALPTVGMAADAAPQLASRLGRLRDDLRRIEVPAGAEGVAVGSALERISRALDVAGDVSPDQALRQLYRAPAAIDEILGEMSVPHRNALDAYVGYRGMAEGTSDLLSGQGGVRGLTDKLDEMMGESSFGEAGQFLVARRAAQREVAEAIEAVRQNFEVLNDGRALDSSAFNRILKEAEASGDVETLSRLADLRAHVVKLQAQSDLFPELADIGGGRNQSGTSLDEYIAGAYATARTNKIARLEGDASKGPQQVIRQALGGIGIAGAALAAGPVGVIGGLGVAGLAVLARSPFGMRRMAARVRNAFDAQGVRLGRSLDSTTKMAHSSSRTPFLQRISPRAGSLAAFSLNRSQEEKGELYSELVARIQEMQENPMAMAEALTPQTEVIGDMVPGLNTAAGMQGHRQLAALTAALPLSARTQSAMARLSGPPPLPSATAINEFLQVASVVEDPVHGIDLMNAGRLTRGSAAAIATAFPNFHEEVTARIISDIARAAQRQTRRRRGGTSGPRLNYQASLMMSRFVGFPLDNTMEAGFQAAVTSQAAQTTQQDTAQQSRPVSVREPSFLQNEQTVTGRIGN